jgi:hypothetical protein
MRILICVLCVMLGITATGNTGKKEKAIRLKIENVQPQGIRFETIVPKGDTKKTKKSFMVKFAETNVKVVTEDGKIIPEGTEYIRKNAAALRGRIIIFAIENGGEEPVIPPKKPLRSIKIWLKTAGKGGG